MKPACASRQNLPRFNDALAPNLDRAVMLSLHKPPLEWCRNRLRRYRGKNKTINVSSGEPKQP